MAPKPIRKSASEGILNDLEGMIPQSNDTGLTTPDNKQTNEQANQQANGNDTAKDTQQNDKQGNMQLNQQNSSEDNKQDNAQQNKQDSGLDNRQDNKQPNQKDNHQYNEQSTIQSTNKYTVQLPDKTELYNERVTFNVSRRQKKYIKEIAKHMNINESEFGRFMIDYFINNVEVK